MSKTYVCNTPVPAPAVSDTEQEVNNCEANRNDRGSGCIKNNEVQVQQLFDDVTNSSIIEFLNQENQCYYDTGSEIEIESIFEEIHRLSGGGNVNTDTANSISDVNVENIIKEAERLITKQAQLELEVQLSTAPQCCNIIRNGNRLNQNQRPLSAESTPREMKKGNDVDKVDNDNEVCRMCVFLYLNKIN